MVKKHDRTLKAVFSDPVQAGIVWRDIEAMLKSFGAEISERRGSRICISLNGIDAVFHRPHPRKEAEKGAISSMRRFLKEARIDP
ncbi:MAG: HicA protein [Alphaproteobacteria bacterium]|jgi:hypothetical protein|nr:HicA protein [Alphaproteobacteria bacterium]MDF3033628.1 HicA protein [Alphaproteobacteria bacterium]